MFSSRCYYERHRQKTCILFLHCLQYVVGMADYTEMKLDITADDRIFTPRGVGALNIGIVQCLSELIANSLDWKRFSKEEIESIRSELEERPEQKKEFIEEYEDLLESGPKETVIKIQYNGDSIEIWDNGIGMSMDQLEVGLRLRAASDKKREPLRARKGMFGMGMKVGILGMGWKFTIRTRPLSDNVENVIQIDTREIEEGNLRLKEITGRVYSDPSIEGPLEKIESGTYIKIEDLHKTKHNPVTWREEIGRNFSPELEYDEVRITVIDNSVDGHFDEQECTPEIIPIFPDSKMSIDELGLHARRDNGDGTFGNPIQITGWLALRVKSASGSGLWGVHTFRKGQLVEPFHNDGPRNNGLLPKDPHPTLARLHGEIHLDMCDPNFTKVGWNTELKSWVEARDALEPILTKMLDAAKAYRKSKSGGAKYRKLMQRAKSAARESVEKLTDEDEIEDPEHGGRDYVGIGDGEHLKISVTEAARPNSNAFWDYSFRIESNEIAVVINTESDLWQWASEQKNPEGVAQLIINWAIVDSLYFCLVDYLGIEPNRAIQLRDKWHSKLYMREEDAN